MQFEFDEAQVRAQELQQRLDEVEQLLAVSDHWHMMYIDMYIEFKGPAGIWVRNLRALCPKHSENDVKCLNKGF